jgi:quercetin dioxygenase-like cupin family protein
MPGVILKLYSFEEHTQQPIHAYDSQNAAVTHLIESPSQCSLVCIRLGRDGVLGRHRAVQNQLFIVVEGEGYVSGESDMFVTITAGQAAFWAAGEMHTTKTQTGLTAIVAEGADVLPGTRLELVYEED